MLIGLCSLARLYWRTDSLLFQLLVAVSIPLLMAQSLLSLPPWPHSCLLFCWSNLPLPHSYKDTCHLIYPDNPRWSPHLTIFNFIISAKPFFFFFTKGGNIHTFWGLEHGHIFGVKPYFNVLHVDYFSKFLQCKSRRWVLVISSVFLQGEMGHTFPGHRANQWKSQDLNLES